MGKLDMFFNGKTVFITGAASGIGRATALKLAGFGAKVLLADINIEALRKVEQEVQQAGASTTRCYQLDVSNFEAMEHVADAVHAEFVALDILINNAGVGMGGSFVNTSVDDWRWIMGINLMGVVHGCKVFVEPMIKAQSGHIVNLASVAGYYAAPDMSAYSATKHAVMGLTESLRYEVAGQGIGVSAICPGVINTNIINNGKLIASKEDQDRIAKTYVKRNYGPELVADAIVKAIVKNKAVVPVSPESWLIYGGKRFVPAIVDVVSKSNIVQKTRI